MSLHPSLIEPVPEQKTQIAHAAFPKGSPYLTLRDELGTLYRDDDFSTLFPASGQSALDIPNAGAEAPGIGKESSPFT